MNSNIDSTNWNAEESAANSSSGKKQTASEQAIAAGSVLASAAQRLACCRFEIGRKLAIRLNRLSYAEQ